MTISSNKSQLVKYLVTLLAPVFILLIPTSEYFTQELRLFFSITIMYLFLIVFDFMDLLVPSILLSAAYILLKLAPCKCCLIPMDKHFNLYDYRRLCTGKCNG